MKKNIWQLQRPTQEDYRALAKHPIIVVLDNLRSMHNVGSIFRTADAFLIRKVYLCGITPCPPHPDIHKTALGAEAVVEWEHRPSVVDCVQELLREGYEVWSVEQTIHSHPPFHRDPQKRYALVFGNEVRGVSQEVIDLSTGCIEIPQYGTKHSLNVSVAAGITLHHLTLQQ